MRKTSYRIIGALIVALALMLSGCSTSDVKQTPQPQATFAVPERTPDERIDEPLETWKPIEENSEAVEAIAEADTGSITQIDVGALLTDPPAEPENQPEPEYIPEQEDVPTPEPTREPAPEPTQEPAPEPTREPAPEPTQELELAPEPEPAPEQQNDAKYDEVPQPEIAPEVEPVPEPIPEPELAPEPEPAPEQQELAPEPEIVYEEPVPEDEPIIAEEPAPEPEQPIAKEVHRIVSQSAPSASDSSLVDYSITALDESGNVIWPFLIQNVQRPDPSHYTEATYPGDELMLVENNDDILFMANGTLYGLDRLTGTVVLEIGNIGNATNIQIDTDGSIFLSGYAGPLMAKIPSDGSQQWKIDSLDDFYNVSSFTIVGDRLVLTCEGTSKNYMAPAEIVLDKVSGAVLETPMPLVTSEVWVNESGELWVRDLKTGEEKLLDQRANFIPGNGVPYSSMVYDNDWIFYQQYNDNARSPLVRVDLNGENFAYVQDLCRCDYRMAFVGDYLYFVGNNYKFGNNKLYYYAVDGSTETKPVTIGGKAVNVLDFIIDENNVVYFLSSGEATEESNDDISMHGGLYKIMSPGEEPILLNNSMFFIGARDKFVLQPDNETNFYYDEEVGELVIRAIQKPENIADYLDPEEREFAYVYKESVPKAIVRVDKDGNIVYNGFNDGM